MVKIFGFSKVSYSAQNLLKSVAKIQNDFFLNPNYD